jgi:tetratricopeptide (TPR) repeat protein
MKKYIFAVILCLCSFPSYALLSQGEFGIEMAGGYSLAALGNFNSNFTGVFNNGFLKGYASPVSATAVPGILQADIKLRYSVAGGFPLYLRLGFTRLVDTEVLRAVPANIDIVTSVVSFNESYIGAGMKLGLKLSPGFALFIGADGGCFIPFNSYWEVTGNTAAGPPVNNNKSDPLYNAYQRIDFTDIFFGGNANAGIELAVADSWGIILEGGYKLARTPVSYQKTGIFARAGFNLNELDFSGPYATGGLTFYFGGAQQQQQQQTAAEKHNGDYFLKRRDFKNAVESYAAEYKLKPSMETYRKIGICYYYLGVKDKAAFIFGRLLKANPRDREAEAYLKKLKR